MSTTLLLGTGLPDFRPYGPGNNRILKFSRFVLYIELDPYSLSTTLKILVSTNSSFSFNMFFFQLQMRVIRWFTECWTITDVVWHIDLHPINHQVQWGQNCFEVVLESFKLLF